MKNLLGKTFQDQLSHKVVHKQPVKQELKVHREDMHQRQEFQDQFSSEEDSDGGTETPSEDSETYKWDIYVADSADMCLLGLDFLHNYKVDIKLSTNTISINGEEIYASVVRSGESNE